MSTKIRVFVCIELPESERERIAAAQARLKPLGARVAWTAPGNVHLTLAFLGDVSQDAIPDVVAAATRAASAVPRFSLGISGAGAFPSPNRPRVLWAGLAENTGLLAELRARVAGELSALGFATDTKAFKPHLTVGRIKDDRDVKARRTAELLHSFDLAGPAFEVERIVVMRSDLLPAGPKYTPLGFAALARQAGPDI